jgi:hypothetical protein
MSAKQPIFYVSQLARKRKYAIETYIKRNKDGELLFVTKKACYDEGIAHVQNMFSTYNKLLHLSDKTLGIITPIKPTNSGDDKKVLFPYVKGRSAERILLDLILSDKRSEAKMFVQTFLDIVGKLPASVERLPITKNHSNFIGNAYQGNFRCFKYCAIDMNFDNFIINDEGKWYLFDYEFFSENPVPVSFAVLRPFWYFGAVRYSQILKMHSARLPIVEVAPNFFLPSYIWKMIKDYMDEYEFMLAAVEHMQNSIQHGVTVIDKSPPFKKPKPAKPPALSSVDKIIKYGELTKRLNELEADIDKLGKQNLQLKEKEEMLDRIRSAYWYRFIRLLRHPIRKIKK